MASIKQSSTHHDETPERGSPPDRTLTYSKGRTLLFSTFFALVAGLVASLLAVVLMGILRLVAGIPTPMELFGDFVLKHLDVHTFLKLLLTFGPNAKTYPLGLALLGMIGLGTVLGLLYAILVHIKLPTQGYRPSRREWFTGLAFAEVMTLLAIILFWVELRQNFFGLSIVTSRLVTAVGLFGVFNLYGASLCLIYRTLLPKQPLPGVSATAHNRRQLLSRAGIAALTVGSAAATVGLVSDFLDHYAAYDGMKSVIHNNTTPPITTNDEHYVVTQNPIDPTVNSGLWQLQVTGLVGHGGTYTYEEIQKLPSTTRPVTLECIANGRGDHLISTAIWQGITLKSLLDRHGGAKPDARYIAFYAVDGYTVSLPLNEVLAVDPLLVWRMNGADLPQRHGFPMRALIPGRYGEENIKWLTRIELTDHFVGGLYSDQGWYNGPLHTMSRIDRPMGRVPLGQTVEVGGIAFAGNRGIHRVEISADNGKSWHDATLQPPLSQDSWILWTWQWKPTKRGSYTLASRATDGTGAVQTDHEQGTVPNGTTGYSKVMVQVA